MTQPGTLWHMPAHGKPEPERLTPHLAAGVIANRVLGYRGLTPTSAGRLDKNCSTSTIWRIIRGAPNVGVRRLHSLAGILDLPLSTFTLIINMDVKGIKNLVEISEDLRLEILDTLERVTPPPRK